ncbi:ArsR/SmtB family transcription factor [Terricaulis sp.]|uniref:ArsR/SmtB family transcription factor n=1 Tax=Terricaulis sp. TaxID=2768686 RepID=UPI003782E432
MQQRGVLPNDRAEEASQILKALASPHRLMIACRLAVGEATVGTLAARIGVRESVVSQHLAVLRRERLVSARREGQSIHYALKSETARDILGALARAFC